MSEHIRYFSAGCIIPKIFATSMNEWLEETKASLEAIPSIHELHFTGIDRFDFSWRGGEVGVPGDEKIRLPSAGVMQFKIHIPTRLRTELGPPLGSQNVEDFYVMTFFSHIHPVTYVSCRDPEGEVRAPAVSMIIVREFLNAELKKMAPQVELIRIGPTPFHADFFMSPGTGDTEIGGDSATAERSSPDTTESSTSTHTRARSPKVRQLKH